MRLVALEVAGEAWSVPQKPRQANEARDGRVARAIEFVEAQFSSDISLLEISRACGLSPTHLTSLFRRETGKTPYSYVIDRRLREAVRLLRFSGLPIAQVAYEAGFADQQHMTRAFRARLKRTPNAVRRE